MRLRKIRLAGFKSFVDPTSIDIPGNLIAVVGPNGCGKSNIIDAVRWVMGEVSAKHLRGGTMADVVFTGSNSRKPVGQASVELVFDNTEGRLGGRFAAYQEMSVKRQVTRDSQSSYFLNGARCRRRDVMDVVLGTGLGPRSYAIIEQGMISRLVEAKPEELREFLEEAAGISKYKERRRETENRIRHTNENLDRLNDLREELGKQLAHLKRQATQAERYKEYKAQERQLKSELLALRWQRMDGEASAHQERIRSHEIVMEKAQAELRRVEAELERQRAAHGELNEAFNAVYRQVVESSAAIARGEESIQGMRERREHLRENLQSEEHNLAGARQHMREDEAKRASLTNELEKLEPALAARQARAAQARLAYRQTDEAMHAWQTEWEDLTTRVAEPARTVHAEQARIQQIEHNCVQLKKRVEQLTGELRNIETEPVKAEVAKREASVDQAEDALARLERERDAQHEHIAKLRQDRQQQIETLDGARAEQQELRGRLASLQALQEEALGRSSVDLRTWLEQHGLQSAKRLAELVEAEEGWEAAIEMVLGHRLEAVQVEDLSALCAAIGEIERGKLTVFSPAPALAMDAGSDSLAAKAKVPDCFSALLRGVRTAGSLVEAIEVRSGLSDGESVITANGIWLGRGWAQVSVGDAGDSVLRRERELEALNEAHVELSARIEALAKEQALGEEKLAEAEEHHAVLQNGISRQHRSKAALQSELGEIRARLHNLQSREGSLRADIGEAKTRVEAEEQLIQNARERLAQSEQEVVRLSVERDAWSKQRDQHRQRLEEARERWQTSRDEVYDLGLKVEGMRTQVQSLAEGRTRSHQRVETLTERCRELREQLSASAAPLDAAGEKLEQDLNLRSELEQALEAARQRVDDAETKLQGLDKARVERGEATGRERETLQTLRLEGQEVLVRRRTLEEQLKELDLLAAAVLENLDEGASEQAWEERLEQLERRISRLGPINLAAIEEHAQNAERKEYLDAQHADLEEALDTLQSAIRKLDRETRTRFKETYEKVNAGLSATFPRLFGGGQASLELTGEDLLDTGVSVMARPPGKRNSSIHLLSGGEKALAAVALVFSIFELNPAPFCLLDEVDAPLDDVNVVRFTELVKEMSERVQLVVVTHNKITMESCQQLIGVTMNEPGVSRLVAVDIEEAVELASV